MRGHIALVIVLAMKFGKLLLALFSKLGMLLMKLLKGAKTTKFALAAGSFGAYAVLLDWRFAATILLLIGIHESGHVWAMRRMGMATRGFYFVPLLGGAAVPDSAFPSAWAEAYVALMGPIWGLFVSAVTYIVYRATGEAVFEVAACWMAFVNLVNLIPMAPLDGGRVIHAFGQSLGSTGGRILALVTGFAGMAFCAWSGFWLFAGFGVMGIIEQLGLANRHQQLRARWDYAARQYLMRSVARLAKVLGLPTDAPLSRVLREIERLRKHPALRRELGAIEELRRAYARLERRYLRPMRRRVHEECGRATMATLSYELIREAMLRKRQEHVTAELALVKPRTVQAYEQCGAEVMAFLKHARPVVLAAREQLMAHIGATDDPTAFFVTMFEQQHAAYGEDREQVDEPKRLVCDAETALLIMCSPDCDPMALQNSAAPHWSDAPFPMLFMLATSEQARGELAAAHGFAQPVAAWNMTPAQRAATLGTAIVLTVTLFLLMTITGGHEAARGAVEFFRAL
ncbi:MAG: site-2 protease family protein [bacterium]|nr:site-2 protease family protein [bacterium]